MEYMAQSMRAAKEIAISHSGDTTSASVVVLKVPSYNNSGIIADTYDYISYRVDGDTHNLERTVWKTAGSRNEETDRVLAKGVSSLSFEYLCRDSFTGNGTSTGFNVSHD
jgi:hypothetical protein